jgi:hypothetical protein
MGEYSVDVKFRDLKRQMSFIKDEIARIFIETIKEIGNEKKLMSLKI